MELCSFNWSSHLSRDLFPSIFCRFRWSASKGNRNPRVESRNESLMDCKNCVCSCFSLGVFRFRRCKVIYANIEQDINGCVGSRLFMHILNHKLWLNKIEFIVLNISSLGGIFIHYFWFDLCVIDPVIFNWKTVSFMCLTWQTSMIDEKKIDCITVNCIFILKSHSIH